MKRRSFIAGSAMALAAPGLVLAGARAYPSRPVRLIVPFAAGQGSDVLARAIGKRLYALWGQPVIVENRAGANGTIAVNEVLKSPGDGHTLLVTSNSPIVINPSIYKHLSYDVRKDLKPVMLLSTTDVGLMVHPDVPARDVGRLIQVLKQAPGKYSYGSIGVGSTSHLAMETFKRATGVQAVHVPYRGSSLAMTDLIAGTIQLMFDGLPSSLPHVHSGRIRALAISGSHPSRFLPGVPALGPIGVQGTPDGGWYGLLVSASVDDALVRQLNADFASVLREPDIRAQLTVLAMDAVPVMNPSQFADFIGRQTAYWDGVAHRLGIYRAV